MMEERMLLELKDICFTRDNKKILNNIKNKWARLLFRKKRLHFHKTKQ